MLSRRNLRQLVARVLLGTLLYAQWVVAAHACAPSGATGAAMHATALPALMTQFADHAQASHAKQPDLVQPSLCAAHCQSRQQSAEIKPVPSPTLTLLAGYFTLDPVVEGERHGQPSGFVERPSPMADPPHAILHCCYRI